MDPALIKTSKFLSLVLRHKPQRIGITLDEAGWVSIDTLLEAANASGKKMDRALLDRVVKENDKQRFAISEDGTRIRANQGHSVSVSLGLEPVAPPEVLYHGTVERFLKSIKEKGLIPGKRHHVHLSATIETAEKVGSRRGEPFILKVDAAQMAADGFVFFQSENGVWLTDHVPAEYLDIQGHVSD